MSDILRLPGVVGHILDMLSAEDTYVWRVVFALFTGLLFLFFPAGGQNHPSPRPDFSGSWDMDFSRSESAHQDVPIGSVSLIIRQTPSDISIETRRAETPSSPVMSEKLVFLLNGAERTNSAATDQPVKAKAHWDGLKLVAETEREINGATVTTMQVFRLADSGREITVEKTLSVQHGYQSPGTAKTTGTGRDIFVRAKR
jgi:hypothetical protein